MTEQAVVEYVTNCAWQIPLLAAGAWVMVRLARPAVRTEYWLWVAVLAMAVVLPMRGVDRRDSVAQYGVRAEPRMVVRLIPVDAAVDAGLIGSAGDAVAVRARVVEMASVLRGFRLQMSVRATHWFVGLYGLAMFFAGLRLFGAWIRARRLVRGSREMVLGAEAMQGLREVGAQMGVEVPEIRESSAIAGPMIVGALRPVVLLPEGAREYGEEELRAALCHELAHVRRHDYLVNLLCEAVMVPVSWHPVANAVERRIQQTREMVCDEMAAEGMESGEGYARCLVSVTRRIMERPVAYERTQAVEFFDRNTLEERVMRLTSESEVGVGRSGMMRVVCGGLVLATVVGVAATFHVRPAFGAETTVQSQAAVTSAATATGSVEPAVTAKPSAAVPEVDAKVKAQRPVAIARGKHATVTAEPGEYVHRWQSQDGEAFAMVNHDAAEPSEDEQKAVEEKLEDARIVPDSAVIRLDMPDVKLDMPEIKLDMKRLDLDKVQIDRAQRLLSDPALKAQIANAERQMAVLRLNPPQIDLSKLKVQLDMANDVQIRALVDSRLANEAEINAEIAKGMEGNAAGLAKLQKEIESGELNRKLEAAQRTLDEVKRRLEEMQKK